MINYLSVRTPHWSDWSGCSCSKNEVPGGHWSPGPFQQGLFLCRQPVRTGPGPWRRASHSLHLLVFQDRRYQLVEDPLRADERQAVRCCQECVLPESSPLQRHQDHLCRRLLRTLPWADGLPRLLGGRRNSVEKETSGKCSGSHFLLEQTSGGPDVPRRGPHQLHVGESPGGLLIFIGLILLHSVAILILKMNVSDHLKEARWPNKIGHVVELLHVPEV